MSSFYIPIFSLFLGLIIVEAWVSAKHHLHVYQKKDTIVNILIALSSFVVNIGYRGVALYVLTIAHSVSVFSFNKGVIYWILLFLLSDLVAYGFHYLSHKSRFFWASHIIHHSSEKYNLTTAIRVPLTNFFYRFLFYMPLCFLGFDPLDVLIMETIIYMYNFYLHTEFIRNMGWLEWIFNTPSHHRVHHGKDEKYLDRNFGGILIIWDRLFKTFVKEQEKPSYGTTKRINSHNYFTVIGKEWADMFRDVLKANNWHEQLMILFNKPGWQPKKKFANKWALVTGASSGIGLAIAEKLANEGANLVLVALPDSGLKQISKQMKMKYKVKVHPIETDLSLEESTYSIWNQCRILGAEINIMINNAGIGSYKFFDQSTLTEILHLMKVNNESLVLLTHQFISQLRNNSTYYLLNVASMASFSPVPCKSVYSATKSFVFSFTKSLKMEYHKKELMICCLLPGSTQTSLVAQRNIATTPFHSKFFIQSAAQVAQVAIEKMHKGQFKIIPGFHNRVIYYFWKICPPVIFQTLLKTVFLKKRVETSGPVPVPGKQVKISVSVSS